MKKKQAKKKATTKAPPVIKKVVAPKKKAARIAQIQPQPIPPTTTITITPPLVTADERDKALAVLVEFGRQRNQDFYLVGGEKGAFGRRKPLAAIAITKDAIELLSSLSIGIELQLDASIFG